MQRSAVPRRRKAGPSRSRRRRPCRDYIPQAIAQGCDTFVTADLRYNDFLDTHGLNLIDAGHYPTENVVCEAVRAYLAKSFPLLEVVRSASHHDAIQYYL